MIEQADVIVIGAGGLGAATAFYLVKRGARDVVLLDKHDIGSQTSPRAAGMVSCVRKSELMIELIKLAAEKIQRFTQETGQPLDWVRSGSLKVARRAQDVAVIGVDTSLGTIHGPIVVDAAGAWTRQIAEASGLRIPLVPTAQQLFVTHPLPGVRADLPMVRIMDAAVYVRPCDGGLLWGVYEEDPRVFDMSSLGESFQIKDMPLAADVLWRYADDVKRQLPVLLKANVREHRGGIPTMTADGQHIVGPIPAARGFFFASGCNVAGLSISPALGDALAAWILDGAPPMDLTPLAVTRFASGSWSEEQLRQRARWQYGISTGRSDPLSPPSATTACSWRCRRRSRSSTRTCGRARSRPAHRPGRPSLPGRPCIRF
jgi:glycine/D-amino acid oxidase-like deaminating enzyme